MNPACGQGVRAVCVHHESRTVAASRRRLRWRSTLLPHGSYVMVSSSGLVLPIDVDMTHSSYER